MAGQRLSQRLKGAEPDGPYKGVPEHLKHGLVHWWGTVAESGSGGYYGHERQLRELAALLRSQCDPRWTAGDLGRAFITSAIQDDEFFLDLVDGTLQTFTIHSSITANLTRLLDIAGSVWTLAPDGQSLVSVVSAESQATYEQAVSVADDAAKELRVAWTNAFGRNGDPSDAWDHAIKAMEALFIPLVIPKKDKANLGGVIGELRNQGHVWKFVLPGKEHDNDVSPLVGMLDGIWPNVDRHQGNAANRPPTEPEARAVVTLAATIVQWHREGWVIQKR
jgi:hypothetical protein